MAGKFYGAVGYAEMVDEGYGVWKEKITEVMYRGDVLKNMSRTQQTETLNEGLRMDSRVSIMADAYAINKSSTIRYVVLDGQKWKVTAVEIARPRLLLTVGGVYVEQT